MTDSPDPDETPAAMTRRGALSGLAALAGLAAAPAWSQSASPTPAELPDKARRPPADGPRVAMVVYPRMVLLDLVGPQTVLKIAGCQVDLVGRDRQPVATDVGISVAPTATFDDYDSTADVLFVPGGLMGSIAAMEDEPTLAFLRRQGADARWVTSVCTGSLMLGAAGLLDGYRATSHWGVRDLLPTLGATLGTERVVEDRNRITGGGVTAGLDFGLVLAERLFDREKAEWVQLILEYAPEPPFEVGTPELAGAERMEVARSRRVWMDGQAREAAERAALRLSAGRP